MRIAIERLLALRSWQLALLSCVVLAGIVYLAFLLSADRQAPPVSPPLQAQWRRVIPLRAALAQRVTEEWTTRRFSPLESPIPGITLQRWQPRGGGGEMLAAVSWQAVPALFAWLADCGVRVAAFSLNDEKGALQMSLQLESDDET